MSFRVQTSRRVNRKLASWGLPDPVLVEAHLRLNEDLADTPKQFLRRLTAPFDGLTYAFSMIDPENRMCEHYFMFHVHYGQDEESIHVTDVAYLRGIGV